MPHETGGEAESSEKNTKRKPSRQVGHASAASNRAWYSVPLCRTRRYQARSNCDTLLRRSIRFYKWGGGGVIIRRSFWGAVFASKDAALWGA